MNAGRGVATRLVAMLAVLLAFVFIPLQRPTSGGLGRTQATACSYDSPAQLSAVTLAAATETAASGDRLPTSFDLVASPFEPTTATGVAAEAGGAYGTALSGGRHSGFLANYAGKPTAQIERGITSIEKQIAEHQAKIANPGRYIDEWASLDPRQQQALLNSKWPGDIARQQEQLDILRGILGSR